LAADVQQFAKLLDQAGTVKVRAPPLCMLIGAAVAGPNGPDIATIIDMLDPAGDDDADA
jgi:hypothetical protein